MTVVSSSVHHGVGKKARLVSEVEDQRDDRIPGGLFFLAGPALGRASRTALSILGGGLLGGWAGADVHATRIAAHSLVPIVVATVVWTDVPHVSLDHKD